MENTNESNFDRPVVTEQQMREEMTKTHWMSTLLDESSDIDTFRNSALSRLREQKVRGSEVLEQLTWQTMVQITTHELHKEKPVSDVSADNTQASIVRNERLKNIIVALVDVYARQTISDMPDVYTAFMKDAKGLGQTEFWKSNDKLTQFASFLDKTTTEVREINGFLYGDRDYKIGSGNPVPALRPQPLVGTTDAVTVAGTVLDRYNNVINALSMRTQMAQLAFNKKS